MKNLTPNSLRLIPAALCLLFCILANHAGAAVFYWDPQGTTGANPYLGSMTGTWENSSWSSSGTGVATPVAWVEGDAACFAVHSGIGTPAFTVTMNGNHTVAGIFDGPLTPNSANVTINGTGIMTMQPANLNGFALNNASDGSLALVTINVVIAGGSTAGICAEESGQLFLNGVNTYVGGTYLGYSGSSFSSGIWNFNNSASHGEPGSAPRSDGSSADGPDAARRPMREVPLRAQRRKVCPYPLGCQPGRLRSSQDGLSAGRRSCRSKVRALPQSRTNCAGGPQGHPHEGPAPQLSGIGHSLRGVGPS